MKFLIPLLFLFACATEQETDEETVLREQEAADRAALRQLLNRLEAQTADLTVSAAARGVTPGDATPMTNAEHIKEVYDLLLYLENRVLELENGGIARAQDVSYDPRATKVSSKKVQGALDEIENRIQEIEDKVDNSAGAPGTGMYSLDGGGGGPPRGGGANETQGANDGPSDIPPGGGGGGGHGNSGGGQMGGQSGGQMGGQSGGQSGGGQDGGQSGGGQDGGSQGGGGMRGNTGQ
jgi:hypothetical protein